MKRSVKGGTEKKRDKNAPTRSGVHSNGWAPFLMVKGLMNIEEAARMKTNNTYGVFSPPGSKTHRQFIRLIDSEYKEKKIIRQRER
jgi:hypothetical protein